MYSMTRTITQTAAIYHAGSVPFCTVQFVQLNTFYKHGACVNRCLPLERLYQRHTHTHDWPDKCTFPYKHLRYKICKQPSSSQVAIWCHINISFNYAENTHPYRQGTEYEQRTEFLSTTPLHQLFTQINIGYRQHGQKKMCKVTTIVLLQPTLVSADKSFETKQHKIPQKSEGSPTFTCMQANMVKLRGAIFTTFVAYAPKWWVWKRQ